jgi:MoxR-like ATPase
MQLTDQQIHSFRDDFDALRGEIGKVVVGQTAAIDGLLIAAVAGGHALIEGTPGLGKTVLVRTLAQAVELSFQRIQFTPDLMPSDLLGTYVVMETPQGRRTFEFQKGPIFSHLILADQINRGAPKTQSALLEAMEGQEISVSNETFRLPEPFCVVATQNPLEMEGTFPLPEPELDRFMLKLTVGPLTMAEIEEILNRTTESIAPVVHRIVDGRRLLEMRSIARAVSMERGLRRWAIGLALATCPEQPGAPEQVRRFVRYGSSPRGVQALTTAAKIKAASEGRASAVESDVRAVVHAALRHRVILNIEGQAENISPDRLIDAVFDAVPRKS